MAKNQYKQNLHKVIALRVTLDEYELLKAKADDKDVKLSEFCRVTLLKNVSI